MTEPPTSSVLHKLARFMGLVAEPTDHSSVPSLEARIRTLEAQVGELMRVSGVDPAMVPPLDPCSAEVRQLARAGKEVEAVRLHRQQTGASLSQAVSDVRSTS